MPAIAISVGMVEIPKGKGKAKMMKGGMANKRQHMYVGGGSITDKLKPMPKGAKGKGLRNLPDSVQMNMGFDPKVDGSRVQKKASQQSLKSIVTCTQMKTQRVQSRV